MLKEVEVELVEVGERGVAGPEVVDLDADPDGLQPARQECLQCVVEGHIMRPLIRVFAAVAGVRLPLTATS
jgi:hypothetical protein